MEVCQNTNGGCRGQTAKPNLHFKTANEKEWEKNRYWHCLFGVKVSIFLPFRGSIPIKAQELFDVTWIWIHCRYPQASGNFWWCYGQNQQGQLAVNSKQVGPWPKQGHLSILDDILKFPPYNYNVDTNPRPKICNRDISGWSIWDRV